MSEGKTVERIHVGPKHVGEVCLTDITILRQYRTTFNKVELEELATSMVDDPKLVLDPKSVRPQDINENSFDLTTPMQVGVHDYLSAVRYIQDHGDHYRIPLEERVKAEDLPWREDGTTVILIDGERRTRSLKTLAERFKLDPSVLFPEVTIFPNISFASANRRQLKANISSRPAPEDEAASIALAFKDIERETGSTPTITHFAASIGFSETKVRDALAFDSLPENIRLLVSTAGLSYTVVKTFKPLMDAYYRLDGLAKGKEVSTNVSNYLMAEAQMLLKKMQDAIKDKRRFDPIVWLEGRSSEVNSEAAYQNELFTLEAAKPAARRAASAHQLSQTALSSLRYQAAVGELSADKLTEIERLHEEIGQLIQEAKDKAIAMAGQELDLFADPKALAG